MINFVPHVWLTIKSVLDDKFIKDFTSDGHRSSIDERSKRIMRKEKKLNHIVCEIIKSFFLFAVPCIAHALS